MTAEWPWVWTRYLSITNATVIHHYATQHIYDWIYHIYALQLNFYLRELGCNGLLVEGECVLQTSTVDDKLWWWRHCRCSIWLQRAQLCATRCGSSTVYCYTEQGGFIRICFYASISALYRFVLLSVPLSHASKDSSAGWASPLHICSNWGIIWPHMILICLFKCYNKNLAITNRSRVSCAHDTLRTSIGINITSLPWNLG